MVNFEETFSDIRKTFALSAVFHLLLALILLIVGTGFDFDNREFSEVSFIASTRPPSPRRAQKGPTQPTRQAQSTPQQAKEVVQEEPKETTTTKREPVDLPKRRMLEPQEPEQITRESDKIAPTAAEQESPDVGRTFSESEYQGRDLSGTTPGERVSAGTSSIPQGGREIAPSSDIGGPTTSQPFFIEGDAAQRRIQNQVIPEYPAGLQKEATVKIRFTVLPDGRVGEMIPMQKGGDATLEQITMNALRQWRFNPLSPSAPQVNVQGIITFNYILR